MIKALIYLPAVSKTIAQVKVPQGGRAFRRCPEHDNLLCLDGRPLDMAEFNAIAPKMIHPNLITQLGSLPCVKLVEVVEAAAPTLDVVPPASEPVLATVPPVVPPSAPVNPPVTVLPENVVIEIVEGGFVLGDYRAEAAAFMGAGDAGWQGDVSLVEPFATPDAATAAFAPVTDVTPPTPVEAAKETPPTAPKAAKTPTPKAPKAAKTPTP